MLVAVILISVVVTGALTWTLYRAETRRAPARTGSTTGDGGVGVAADSGRGRDHRSDDTQDGNSDSSGDGGGGD